MRQKPQWFNNSKEELLLKPDQEIPQGFVKGRLKKPKKIDTLITLVSKEEIYNEYIFKNKKFTDVALQFNLSNKDFRLLLNHYRIYKDPKKRSKNNLYKRTHEQSLLIGKKSAKTQKQKWNSKSDEEKIAWSKRCSEVELNLPTTIKQEKKQKYLHYLKSLSQEQQKSINIKRSNSLKKTWESNKDVILSKMKNTEKLNRQNRKCRTKSEQLMFDFLCAEFSDVTYDVKVDERYPFFCDFYIKEKDLFIELNAHPSHGRLPLSNLLYEEYSTYPTKWVDVFAKRDVEKQKMAREHRLNYIMIYPNASLEENLTINTYEDSDLIKKLYLSQH